MFRKILDALRMSLKSLFGNVTVLGAMTGCFVAMLLAIYPMMTLPVARFWQVFLIFVMACIVPVLFFMIQTMGVHFVDPPAGLSQFLSTAGRQFWKLMLASIPFLILIGLAIWGIDKLESAITGGMRDAANAAGVYEKVSTAEKNILYIHMAVGALKLLFLCLVLPMFFIQLWNRVALSGARNTFRHLVGTVAASFRPRVVITYLLGALVFILIPYYLITIRIPIKAPWLELFALGLRLTLAIMIAYFGWIITVGAIRLLDREITTTANV